jgi:methylated-DNA-[protein]-cysteine S-methyltransferase
VTSPSADPANTIATVSIATPWGPAVVAAGIDGVHGVGLLTTEFELARSVARRVGRAVVPLDDAPPAVARVVRGAADEVERFVADAPAGQDGTGRAVNAWAVPIRLEGVSDWDRRVLGAVSRIPWGSTASYGEVARAAGSPGAARAAGGAVGRNPIGLMIPCHRVIAGDGSIGGYGGSWPGERDALIALKRALLRREGIEI